MKTIPLLSCLCICLSACATTAATAPAPVPETAAPSASATREPGTMVVRKPLVEVGTADLLEPIPVPVEAPAIVTRTASVATEASMACDVAPGGVRVANATEFPVVLTVDGAPVAVVGAGTLSRFIAPRSSAYLCLDPARAHVFDGFALRESNGRLFAIPNRFRSEVAMGTDGQVTYRVSYALIAEGR